MKKQWWMRLLLWLCAASCAPVQAQLRLPSLPSSLPALPSPVERPVQQVLSQSLSPTDLLNLRRDRIGELLRREPRRLERDPAGELIVRGEVVLQSPSVALLDAAQAAGFRPLRDEKLEPLGLSLVTLQSPPGLDTASALALLRRLDPQGAQDFNHLYLPVGAVSEPTPAQAPSAQAGRPTADARVGLIDGGVDPRHPALRGVPLRSQGCDGRSVPDRHGTAVASLLVGQAPPFLGAVPGAALYAADIYCGEPTGGSVEAVLRSLAWMAQERVAVVNMSIVGPPNRVLEQAVKAMLARGHVLVAAVGNDGPAAPPLYPASYAGVVGVTGVDPRQRVLPEAAQGPQVMFAAPGSELAVAGTDGRAYVTARGTSFAAPLVAGLLARQLREPSLAASQDALALLARDAVDLGAPGRDPVFGVGLVAQQLRVEPAAVRAQR
jgi:subtilisin family serine protease